MRLFRSLVGVVAVGACAALAGLPAVAQAAPTAPYTTLVVNSTDDESLGQGFFTGVFDAGNAEMVPEVGEADAFTLTARQQAEEVWTGIRATPPAGQTWQAGATYPASSAGGADALLSLDATGRTCTGTGKIKVREVQRDAAGRMTAFAAAYQYQCAGSSSSIDGEIRWNSSLDYAAVEFPSSLAFGQVVLGNEYTKTVTFTSKGTAPVNFGVATIEGADGADFRVVQNGCAGRALATGQTCDLRVAVAPTFPKVLQAFLVLADDTAYGKRRARLFASAYDDATGIYFPVRPARLLDTRNSPGVPVGPGGVIDLQVTGRADVDDKGVAAVVLNVTVVGPTADSFLTLYPSGEPRPTASSINFAKGWLGSNQVIAKPGADGKIRIYNRAGSTHVVVDVSGFWTGPDMGLFQGGPSGQFHPMTPTRVMDTRTSGDVIFAGSHRRIWADFGPDLSRYVGSLVLNVTVVASGKSGYATVWSGSGGQPQVSTVNYGADAVVPNMTMVETTPCVCGRDSFEVPSFIVYSSQQVHVVVDVVGVIDNDTVPNGMRFVPVSPTRIVDSRTGLGTSGALGPDVTRKVTAPAALLTDQTRALALNVTAVAPTRNTVVTVWPADTGLARPTASNVNPAAGQIVSNAAVTGIGPQDAFNLHNMAGDTHLVADVVGTFELYKWTAGTGGDFRVVGSGLFG